MHSCFRFCERLESIRASRILTALRYSPFRHSHWGLSNGSSKIAISAAHRPNSGTNTRRPHHARDCPSSIRGFRGRSSSHSPLDPSRIHFRANGQYRNGTSRAMFSAGECEGLHVGMERRRHSKCASCGAAVRISPSAIASWLVAGLRDDSPG